MSVPYETLYGSPLLDEIHNHFPALLYAPDEFSNMRDVLRYIQNQTRSRYDLFSHGLRNFQAASASRTRAVPSSATSSYAPPPPSSFRNVRPRPTQTIISEEVEEDEEGNTVTATIRVTEAPIPAARNQDTTTQLLLSLLGQPPQATNPLTTYTNPRDLDLFWSMFMQPILVRPTTEQLRLYTTLGEVPAEVETCAICQDSFETNRAGRKLNGCGHWFHQTCIDTWFARNVHCPICRHDVRMPASPRVSSTPATAPPPPLPPAPL